jgi:integrase
MKQRKYTIQEFGGGYRIYAGNGKYRKASTKGKAEQIVLDLKNARAVLGRELADIAAPLVAELKKQHDRCLEANTTLEEAVDYWLPVFRARTKSVPLVDAVATYLTDSKGRLKPPTRRDKTQRLNAWVAAQDNEAVTVVDACDLDMVRDYLSDERDRTSDRNHKNIWAVISAFATWCKSRGFLAENPCEKIDTYTRGGHETIAVLTPDEASSLLKIAVLNYNREILSYLVISLFGGLRPHEFITQDKSGAWHHLDWQAIGKDLVKGKNLGKTRKARRVPVGPTFQKWIDFIREKEGGILSGPVVSGYAFYQRFRLWKRAFVPNNIVIEKDVLRHSYGTYRVVLLGEVGKVAIEMGNSEATIKNHYLDGEKSSVDADRYWALTPEVVVLKKRNIHAA